MDEKELAVEMLNFLNDTGQYQDFLNWADNRGFDADELDKDMDKLEDF